MFYPRDLCYSFVISRMVGSYEDLYSIYNVHKHKVHKPKILMFGEKNAVSNFIFKKYKPKLYDFNKEINQLQILNNYDIIFIDIRFCRLSSSAGWLV